MYRSANGQVLKYFCFKVIYTITSNTAMRPLSSSFNSFDNLTLNHTSASTNTFDFFALKNSF